MNELSSHFDLPYNACFEIANITCRRNWTFVFIVDSQSLHNLTKTAYLLADRDEYINMHRERYAESRNIQPDLGEYLIVVELKTKTTEHI